ncbi:MAG: nucleotidyltransferase family protein [Desulfurispora sp.]|uniref:nucleotidyltransferase family protein n=1 Tax=Desulfurispora sp. TaxID=3014275 RepID=UPI0040494689
MSTAKHVMTWEEYLPYHLQQARREKQARLAYQQAALHRVEQLARELPRQFPLQRIYLFGSLLEESFSLHSDIDIAIAGLPAKLHFKAITFAEKIAHPYAIDVVLLEEAPLSLWNKIISSGVVIFESGKGPCLPKPAGGPGG